MIGVAVGPVVDRIPDWRKARGATVGNCVHKLAPDWPGPACNNGVDPAVRRVEGWLVEAPVTCAACRELTAGGAR